MLKADRISLLGSDQRNVHLNFGPQIYSRLESGDLRDRKASSWLCPLHMPLKLSVASVKLNAHHSVVLWRRIR